MVAAEYDRFAVVAFATPAIVEAVEELRRQLPPSGRPILPAHVTVKGTFVDPLDLDAIVDRLRLCCADAQPFELKTIGLRTWTDDAYGAALLEVEDSEPLTALHWRLVNELRGRCTTVYYGEDIGVYTPHLTLVQQIPAEQVDGAVAVIERSDTHYAFPVSEVALVGRRAGVTWKTLATVPIGPADPRDEPPARDRDTG